MKCKKFIKIIFCMFFSVALCVFLSACYDASEVEETAYVIALGIDKKFPEKNVYTFQLAAPLGSSNGGEIKAFSSGEEDEEGGNKTVKNIVLEGENFYDAKNIFANFMSKKISLSHLKLIVFSQSAAETALEEHLNFFWNERQISPKTKVALSNESAEEYLKSVNPELEASTAKYYELSNSPKMLVYAPVKTIKDIVCCGEQREKCGVLPLAKTGNGEGGCDFKSEMFGMGILKNNKITAVCGGDEALAYNILTGQTKNLVYSFSYNKNTAFAKVNFLEKPKYEMKKADGKYTISVFLKAEFDETEGEKLLEKKLETAKRALKEKLEIFLYKTAKEYEADILNFESVEKKRFKTYGEWENSDFEKNYKSCEFVVNLM